VDLGGWLRLHPEGLIRGTRRDGSKEDNPYAAPLVGGLRLILASAALLDDVGLPHLGTLDDLAIIALVLQPGFFS
jgi:hypothetical protein